jgi:hypothetical protein
MVCKEFTEAVNSTLQCHCDVAPDKSVALKCLEINETCNEGGSVCYLQTLNIALTPTDNDNKIRSIESCTRYVADLVDFSESSTKFANYSALMPWVEVIPVAPNDFSSVASCTATFNRAKCYTSVNLAAQIPLPLALVWIVATPIWMEGNSKLNVQLLVVAHLFPFLKRMKKEKWENAPAGQRTVGCMIGCMNCLSHHLWLWLRGFVAFLDNDTRRWLAITDV